MLRKATVLTALLATAIAVAACGGSSPTKTTTASSPSHQSVALKLARCMRTHGVPDYPDPGSNGTFGVQASSNGNSAVISVNGHSLNVSGPAFRTAMNECSRYQPHGPAISGSQLAQIKKGAIKMAQCMRAHGIADFADPQVTSGPGGNGIQIRIGGGGGGSTGGSAAPKQALNSSPAFQRAMNACQKDTLVGPKSQRVLK